MEKKRKIREFEIKKLTWIRRVYVGFNKITPYICLKLTYREWDRLLNFFKKTKSKVHLPKHKIQYSEYDIVIFQPN